MEMKNSNENNEVIRGDLGNKEAYYQGAMEI